VSLPAAVDGDGAARAARGLRALLAWPLPRLLVSSGFPVLQEPAAHQDLPSRHDPAAFILQAGAAPCRRLAGLPNRW